MGRRRVVPVVLVLLIVVVGGLFAVSWLDRRNHSDLWHDDHSAVSLAFNAKFNALALAAFRYLVAQSCQALSVLACSLCGRSADAHDRHVRFRLPDPVLSLPDQDRTEGTWKSEDDPNAAVMMQVPQVGPFLRALLPVKLTGGFTVTFGVWIGIHPDDLRRAFDTWWTPEYEQLTIEGRLANALPAWEVFGVPVTVTVTDPETTPYCVSSTDQQLASVLTDQWDHDLILGGLPA